MAFRVGDKVIRIDRDSSDGYIQIGDILTVNNTAPISIGDAIWLEEVPGIYLCKYFKLCFENNLDFEMVPEVNIP